MEKNLLGLKIDYNKVCRFCGSMIGVPILRRALVMTFILESILTFSKVLYRPIIPAFCKLWTMFANP